MKTLNSKFREIREIISSENIPFLEDFRMKYETYFKMGGFVKMYIKPSSILELSFSIKTLRDYSISFKILGGTSNVILLDELHYSVFVSTKNLTNLMVGEHFIEVDSGYILSDFVRVALVNNAVGFEGLEGIPGSLGGAIFMNAGAYGCTIADNLISVKLIDEFGAVKTLEKKQCHFQYRSSVFKVNSQWTIISAKFRIIKGENYTSARNIETFHIARHSYQDFTFPNLGSMFSTNNMYQEILSNSWLQKSAYYVLKILYRNPVSKFLLRKNPSNDLMNKLVKFFHGNFAYPISHKSINILINDGSVNGIDVLIHLSRMNDFFKGNIQIENELVTCCILDMDCELMSYLTYLSLLENTISSKRKKLTH